ncbi:hypothetical protein [Lysinibacillus sp. SGAir0095]|uniref:hypothetical protein n=1 Tax=Lysinibacillus sp. SGAir0095 TaxID=2070463 RepID=UPI0010CD180B|nr:hypothetical protein [Lysinibacillus sp. SGAir0095]QCR31829.1 hypothetical protein C1N55_06400 [Lysinibacillus sp. SGAir0095]
MENEQDAHQKQYGKIELGKIIHKIYEKIEKFSSYSKERKTQSFVFDMMIKIRFSLFYARIDIFHILKNFGIVSYK